MATALATWSAAPDPDPDAAEPAIELELPARARKIGAFEVGRVLPTAARRAVGPFVFLDHMGPIALAPGAGMDVPPHPHIGLATVTYLFEGELFHRDSLGTAQAIRPGAVNWMVAGRGIAHSERTPAEERARGPRVHGLQIWVALPEALEESAPSFAHHPESALPALADRGVRARVVAGTAYGASAPVPIPTPLFYVEASLEPGARLEVPRDHEERALYVVEGAITIDGRAIPPRTMATLTGRGSIVIRATEPTRVAILGGARLETPRHMWWNFVSTSKERIAEAARGWRERRFPAIAGDDAERVPLPDGPLPR